MAFTSTLGTENTICGKLIGKKNKTGVTILVKRDLVADEMTFEGILAEVIRVKMEQRGESNTDFAVMYIPLMISSWRKE